MTGERLYESPIGLYDFQADGVAYCYMRPENIAVWDTGIGKSHLAMATAALFFEDDLIDHMIIVAEKNKLDPDEWPKDLATYTNLTVGKYHGPRRAKVLEELPQVILTTYETARNDAGQRVKVPKRKTPKLIPNFLIEALRGKRIFIVYDEMTKLGNRKSESHQVHELLVKELRKAAETRVLALTATPIERSPENFYNIGRILTPENMGTVASFERQYVKYRDIYDRPTFKNLNAEEAEEGAVPFTDRIAPILLRKRKTDPDVIEQFPQKVEEFSYVDLDSRQRDFYNTVSETFSSHPNQQLVWQLKRQIAGHPMALLHGEGQFARQIVDRLGEETLRAIPSAKSQRLIEYLTPIVKGQGAQVVVFTFFGPSIIPHLKAELEAVKPEPFRVATYYGEMSDKAKATSKMDFRAGEFEVLLSSDSGARGINLPEAMYAVEYEMALTHAMRTQRLNRIHRIDSTHPSVTFQSFIVRDTVEEDIAKMTLSRNEWSDKILDGGDPGPGFVSASMRKELMARAKAV